MEKCDCRLDYLVNKYSVHTYYIASKFFPDLVINHKSMFPYDPTSMAMRAVCILIHFWMCRVRVHSLYYHVYFIRYRTINAAELTLILIIIPSLQLTHWIGQRGIHEAGEELVVSSTYIMNTCFPSLFSVYLLR